jgi:hypothetical protein
MRSKYFTFGAVTLLSYQLLCSFCGFCQWVQNHQMYLKGISECQLRLYNKIYLHSSSAKFLQKCSTHLKILGAKKDDMNQVSS